jgi:addiction module HigA family antidote
MTILRTDLDLGRIDLSDRIEPNIERLAPIHPGTILREEWLEPLDITAYRAARDMGVPPNRMTAILAGDRAITADTALRLARYFGTDAQSWLNLQARFDLEMTVDLHGAKIAREVKPRSAA